jgi:hypothetical protein
LEATVRKSFWVIVISLFAPVLANAAVLNIPAQPLDRSLEDFSKLSGVQITFPRTLAQAHQAPALQGSFSVESALDTLLAKTGLTYHVLGTCAIGVAEAMDEIEVTGKYEKLSAMRKEYELLEEKFYDEYNKLNTNHEYDIHCSLSGTFIKTRECQPAFVERAYRDAQFALGGSAIGSAYMSGGPFAQPSVWVWIQAKLPGYQQNMRDQIRKNPKLLELLMKRNAAAERYQTVRKKKFKGGKVFVWD